MEIKQWHIGPSAEFPFPGLHFFVDLADITVAGRTGGPPTTFENVPWGDTGIPAIPGHYSLHPAPGVAAEIQVVKIPNR